MTFDVLGRDTEFPPSHINYDMISHIANAQAAVKKIKKFPVVDSLEDINKNVDKLYMILILRSLHSNFDHVLTRF